MEQGTWQEAEQVYDELVAPAGHHEQLATLEALEGSVHNLLGRGPPACGNQFAVEPPDVVEFRQRVSGADRLPGLCSQNNNAVTIAWRSRSSLLSR